MTSFSIQKLSDITRRFQNSKLLILLHTLGTYEEEDRDKEDGEDAIGGELVVFPT